MIRSSHVLVLLVSGVLALSACKKSGGDGDTSTAPATAAATATAEPTAAATAAPADTAAPAPSESASAAPADTAAPTAVPVAVTPQRPIDDCCIALAAVATSRHRHHKKVKRDAFRAAEICPGIALLVRQGRATRAQALTQIRSAMAGEPTPAACR